MDARIYNMVHVKCGGTAYDMTMQLADPIDSLYDQGVEHWIALIEKVHSMPGQGVASTFKFGMNYGQWIGILTALQIPYSTITPKKWMAHYGAMPKDKKDRKNYIKAMAQGLYPNAERITLATSDAVLIAHCAMEKHLSKAKR